MADIIAKIEGQELQLMQAWMRADAGAIRKLVHRDCTLMFGTTPPQLLDRPSFLSASESGLTLSGFRLREAVVERYGSAVWWCAGAQLDLKLGGQDWSGLFLITDLWRKYTVGGWKLAQRSLAATPADEDRKLAGAVHRLQLWQ